MSDANWDDDDWSNGGQTGQATVLDVKEDEDEVMSDEISESSRSPSYRQSPDGTSLSCQMCDIFSIPTDMYNFFNTGLVTELILDYNNISKLPEEFCEAMVTLKTLSITGNRLDSLPVNIDGLKHLQVLNLDENRLGFLPKEICSLSKLTKLSMQGNNLDLLPDNFGALKSLQVLSLNENELISLPDSFGLLESLKNLDLSYNKLDALSHNFGSLAGLIVLNLSYNKLKQLPDSFDDLSLIQYLEISNNSLEFLPKRFESKKCLKKLLIDNNELCFLPEWFGDMEDIEEISLQSNFLRGEQFSERFGHTCLKLTRLDASGNLLEHVPESFSLLKNLRFIHLGSPLYEPERKRNMRNGNNLMEIPKEFGLHFSSLTELRLDENAIDVLPDCFGEGMPLLETLDLYCNNIKYLPDSFCKLTKLKIFGIGMNALKRLPDEFGKLNLLEELRMELNQLTSLPPSFSQLINLRVLDLYQNKFDVFPCVLKSLPKIKYLEVGLNITDMVFKINPIKDKEAIERLTNALKLSGHLQDKISVRNGWNTMRTINDQFGSVSCKKTSESSSAQTSCSSDRFGNSDGMHNDNMHVREPSPDECWDVEEFNPNKPYAQETLVFPDYTYNNRSPLKRSEFKPHKLHAPKMKVFRYNFNVEEGQFEDDNHLIDGTKDSMI